MSKENKKEINEEFGVFSQPAVLGDPFSEENRMRAIAGLDSTVTPIDEGKRISLSPKTIKAVDKYTNSAAMEFVDSIIDDIGEIIADDPAFNNNDSSEFDIMEISGNYVLFIDDSLTKIIKKANSKLK